MRILSLLLAAYLLAGVQSQSHNQSNPCKKTGCHNEICSREEVSSQCSGEISSDTLSCLAQTRCHLVSNECVMARNCSIYALLHPHRCNLTATGHEYPSHSRHGQTCPLGTLCMPSASGYGECRCGSEQGPVCNSSQVCTRTNHSSTTLFCATQQEANCPMHRCPEPPAGCRYSQPLPDSRGCLGCGTIVCDLCDVNTCKGHAEVCVKTSAGDECRCMSMRGPVCGSMKCLPTGVCQDPDFMGGAPAPAVTTTTTSSSVNRHGWVWGGLAACAGVAVFVHRRMAKRNERKRQVGIVYDVVRASNDAQEQEQDQEDVDM